MDKAIISEDQIPLFDLVKTTDWKWKMTDYPPSNGLKVFSCFSGAGGSTMGYKLAGCEVIGNCEIDPRMNAIYIKNHHPKFNYEMDIRDFNRLENLPKELYGLDILDGSPPCTPFSMTGKRKNTWGKKKKFREGQAEQILDELSFVFIETANKLKPKVVIMENVEGITFGNAWKYIECIYSNFSKIGYTTHHWICKSEAMGVPQARHRMILIAIRNDLCFDPRWIDMSFNYAPITYGEIKSGEGIPVNVNSKTYKLLNEIKVKEKSLANAHKRLYGKKSFFQSCVIRDNEILPTIRANIPDCYRINEKARISLEDIIHAQTFPEDFDFGKKGNIGYVCGMSVPPVMMKRIAERVIESGIFEI